MVKLLLISDDFTGALDTGIQFAEYSAKTKILTATDIDEDLIYKTDAEVLVIDTETRHLNAEEAYHIVYNLVIKAVKAKVQYIYKKTDSGLRGNVGNELAAVLVASGEKFLPFIPALPSMNRVTIKGVHYIDGVPIHKSAFGQDPFEPVTSPYVKDLFNNVSVQTALIEKTIHYKTIFHDPTIGIFDAESLSDFDLIASHLEKNKQLKIIAGCAGFAVALQKKIGLHKKSMELPIVKKPLLVICGSLNPITKQQIEYGEEIGYTRITLTPDQLLNENYFFSEEGDDWIISLRSNTKREPVVMIDTGISSPEIMANHMKEKGIDINQARVIISKALGSLLTKIFYKEIGRDKTVMIIGGDTMWGFVEKVNCKEINLVCEIAAGTVLSSINIDGIQSWIISKSGGFGNKELIEEVAKKIGEG